MKSPSSRVWRFPSRKCKSHPSGAGFSIAEVMVSTVVGATIAISVTSLNTATTAKVNKNREVSKGADLVERDLAVVRRHINNYVWPTTITANNITTTVLNTQPCPNQVGSEASGGKAKKCKLSFTPPESEASFSDFERSCKTVRTTLNPDPNPANTDLLSMVVKDLPSPSPGIRRNISVADAETKQLRIGYPSQSNPIERSRVALIIPPIASICPYDNPV